MDDRTLARAAGDRFGALANPLRVRILLALAATRESDWTHRGMRYSDLRSAVDVEDGGRLNYHLDELCGEFVGRHDGHYWLTATGSRVVDEIHAGTFSDAGEPVEGALPEECGACGGTLRAAFENGVVTVECPTHGVVFDMALAPGAARDRDLEALVEWAKRRARWYLESVAHDVCPHCSGTFGPATFDPDGSPMAGVANRDPDAEVPEADSTFVVGRSCNRCGVAFRVPLVNYAFTKPPAVAFFQEHGLDVTASLPGDDEGRWTAGAAEREDAAIAWFECDGDRLELVLDRSLRTVEARRSTTEAAD